MDPAAGALWDWREPFGEHAPIRQASAALIKRREEAQKQAREGVTRDMTRTTAERNARLEYCKMLVHSAITVDSTQGHEMPPVICRLIAEYHNPSRGMVHIVFSNMQVSWGRYLPDPYVCLPAETTIGKLACIIRDSEWATERNLYTYTVTCLDGDRKEWGALNSPVVESLDTVADLVDFWTPFHDHEAWWRCGFCNNKFTADDTTQCRGTCVVVDKDAAAIFATLEITATIDGRPTFHRAALADAPPDTQPSRLTRAQQRGVRAEAARERQRTETAIRAVAATEGMGAKANKKKKQKKAPQPAALLPDDHESKHDDGDEVGGGGDAGGASGTEGEHKKRVQTPGTDVNADGYIDPESLNDGASADDADDSEDLDYEQVEAGPRDEDGDDGEEGTGDEDVDIGRSPAAAERYQRAYVRQFQKAPKGTKKHQKASKGTKRHQKAPKGTKRHQKAPKGTKRHLMAPNGT
jgi:hypothetical protein